jgi:hypothetical protein
MTLTTTTAIVLLVVLITARRPKPHDVPKLTQNSRRARRQRSRDHQFGDVAM